MVFHHKESCNEAEQLQEVSDDNKCRDPFSILELAVLLHGLTETILHLRVIKIGEIPPVYLEEPSLALEAVL